jgi:predicted nucleic acid-binding protein
MAALKRAVINASPLICLDKINLLGLLEKVYESIVVTTEVMDEIAAGESGPQLAERIKALNGIKIVPGASAPGELVEWDLGRGETSIIAWAALNPGAELIMDDRAACRCAEIYGHKVTGTIGVLLQAKELGVIAEIKHPLDALVESGFWISDRLRKMVLRQAGEQ